MNIHLESQAYEGVITKHYPIKRDSGLLSWPCYETTMELKGGSSGGPVFISGSNGVVFAVNCSALDSKLSHISSLSPLVGVDSPFPRKIHASSSLGLQWV